MTRLELALGVERGAPPALLVQLRVIDPGCELLYFGEGLWRLGRLKPEDRRIAKAGQRLLASCQRIERLHARRTTDDYRRQLFGRARLHGFQPTAEYRVLGEPTAAIVRDQEVMDFLHRTLTPGEQDAMLDEEEMTRKANAHAELADEYRARDAWRYMVNRSHAVTRFNEVQRMQRLQSSARTTHPIQRTA